MLRRLRVFGMLIGLVLLAACGPTEWPMFRYGPDHSGSSPDASISTDAVQGSMVVDWTASLGPNSLLVSSAAVAHGVVYIGSPNDSLEAFDAGGLSNCSGSPRTCAPLWSAPTGGAVNSSPAVANGVVFVGSDDDKLYAFDAAHGTRLWTATTGGAVEASPTVANGVVYVGTSIDDKLYAFDAAGTTNCSGNPKTCSPLWTATVGGSGESPAVANGVVYGSSGQRLYAFDAAGKTNCGGTPKTCAPLWSGATGGITVSAPAVGPDLGGGARVVYIGSGDGNLYAFASLANTSGCPTNCAPLWTGPTGGSVYSSPAVADGDVYVVAQDGNLYAFDAGGLDNCDGDPTVCRPLWSGYADGSGASSPAVADEVVYVGALGPPGDLMAFDAGGTINCSGRTCKPLWMGKTGGAIHTSPAVANGTVYIASVDGNLYAFGLEKIPPTTSIVQPSNNATVSGTTTLVASASDDVKVSGVEFHLSGGNYHDALIGTAVAYYGWDYNWDTKAVPNGTYTLNSVAYDPAGNVGRSPSVTVTVKN